MLENLFINLKDKKFDPAVEYLDTHLRSMVAIIQEIGEPLEGNIFYEHLSTEFDSGLSPNHLAKRRALSIFAIANNNILEVGFNSGFSALLMLSLNPNLKLTCVDLCIHKYTLPCFKYLQAAFPGRIRLFCGNSLDVLPKILSEERSFDAYHIDGGHSLEVAEKDLINVIDASKNGSIICFDDTDFYELKMMLLKYVLGGKIISVASEFDLIDTNIHMFFKVTKSQNKVEDWISRLP